MVEEAGQLEVRVRSLDGQQVQRKVPLDCRVADLKLRLLELRWPAPTVTQFHLFLRGTKLNVDATIASLALDGEFLVLIIFAKKNQKAVNRSTQAPDHGELQNGSVRIPPRDALPSHGDGLDSHAPSRAEAENGSGDTHTRASEETWRAVATNLASFHLRIWAQKHQILECRS